MASVSVSAHARISFSQNGRNLHVETAAKMQHFTLRIVEKKCA